LREDCFETRRRLPPTLFEPLLKIMSSRLPSSDDELSLKIKIVSCRDLIIADRKTSDPYVKVLMGEKDLHKTKHLMKTLNPVFGPEQDNEFTTQMVYGDLTSKRGLTIEVKDWDRIGTNDVIGYLLITPDRLVQLSASGEPTSIPLAVPPKRKETEAGSITLCIQHTDTSPESKYWIPASVKPASTNSLIYGNAPEGESEPAPSLEEESTPAASDSETFVLEEPPVSPSSNSVASGPPLYNKELLIEVVSCRNLIPADKSGFSDPYVKIRMGSKDLHKTSHIDKTLNPAFLPDHRNTYILKTSPKEVYAKKGIELIVKDHDKGIGAFGFSNDEIGIAKVSADELYGANGEDMEFKLMPTKNTKTEGFKPGGFITIRVREATLGDKDEIKNRSSFIKKAKNKIHSPRAETKKGVSGLDFVDMDEKILLVEIVSCRELLASDKDGSSDPYVKVKLGSKEMLRTDHINKTLNPKFTSKQNNSCIIDCSISELFGAGGISIRVKDWDRGVGGNDNLGSVQISAEALYKCDEEQEFHLDSPPGKNEDAGFISIKTTKISEKERGNRNKGILSFVSKPPVPTFLKQKKRTGPSDTTLLVEVVSCKNLRTDMGLDWTVDPFVEVHMGEEEIHKTETIANNQNPIYTIGKGGVFLFDIMKKDFLEEKKGLTLRVFDRGSIKADNLGQVTVSAEDLIKAEGERMELKLLPPDDGLLIKDAFGAVRGAVGKVGGAVVGGVVGGVGMVGGTAIGAVGKGAKIFGGSTVGKTVGKVGKIVTKPVGTVVSKGGGAVVSGVKAGGGIVVSGVKATGGAVVSGVKTTGGLISGLNPLASTRADDDGDYGFIIIRCREATNYDKKFMKFAEERKGDFLGCRQNTEVIFDTKGGVSRLLGSKSSITEKSGPDAGVEKFLIRPEPDPKRAAVTKYLSKPGILKEALKPSREWLHLGSGTTGRLYVEVIGCDGLPNTDTFGKTDAFALVIFEDAFGKTDVIDDCLSPRWMPWSRRAFMFSMEHPSSDLRVGVFDFDKIGKHDMIGRVAVPVSSLRPDTEYVLTYNLYEDAVTPERKAKGNVTIRVRVEHGSAKQVVMANLSPPVEQFINFQNYKQMELAQSVVDGNTDMVSYGIGTLTMHISELTSFLSVRYYISDAIISLLFWRGQVPVFGNFKIPLHSMIAFYAAITFVECPTLWFSYFWFGNAWLLLAIQNWRNNQPLVWNRTTPFARILMMMALDKAAGPEIIPANFQKKEAVEYEEYMLERIRKADEEYEENNKLWAEHQKETADMDQVGDTDISTKKSSLADYASPFKSILYPIQQLLYTICYYLRIVRNIYLWDEQYYAAFLTAASLVIGLVFYILPWGFILRWTGRLVAWFCFGPHMKLVDIFYYSKLKEATEEEEAKKLSEYYEQLKKAAEENAKFARIRTEEAVKQKSVKEILFGPYVERVPVIKCERFIDLPLHNSHSKKYVAPAKEPKVTYLGGQGLVGTMIPELRSIKDQKDGKAKKDAKEASKSKDSKAAAEEPKNKRI